MATTKLPFKPRPTKRITTTKQPAYLQGDGNYTFIHYGDGTKEIISITLKRLLPRYPALVRVHKSFAINLKCVLRWQLKRIAADNSVLIGCGAEERLLAVSRRRIADIRKALKQETEPVL